MRLVLVTDAWHPQINGVVRTLDTVVRMLRDGGDEVVVIAPGDFRTIACPTYPEIRLAITAPAAVARRIAEARPDAIHIATEGPLGLLARRFCVKRRLPFTTGFHTRFPEYIEARFAVPLALSYAWLRWFHGPSRAVMAPTASIERDLTGRGFANVQIWSRGVDTDLFRPRDADVYGDLPRPIHLNVGRVAVEKNLPAFLDLDLPGSKVVIGDGPQLAKLRQRYPNVHFLGLKTGEDLARHYAAADLFVFPSRTDTFGLVLLEALACGLPVAAYPVPGPRDVIADAPVGCLDEDLGRAVAEAGKIPRSRCRDFALGFSWAACAARFRALLAPFAAAERERAAA